MVNNGPHTLRQGKLIGLKAQRRTRSIDQIRALLSGIDLELCHEQNPSEEYIRDMCDKIISKVNNEVRKEVWDE